MITKKLRVVIIIGALLILRVPPPVKLRPPAPEIRPLNIAVPTKLLKIFAAAVPVNVIRPDRVGLPDKDTVDVVPLALVIVMGLLKLLERASVTFVAAFGTTLIVPAPKAPAVPEESEPTFKKLFTKELDALLSAKIPTPIFVKLPVPETMPLNAVVAAAVVMLN